MNLTWTRLKKKKNNKKQLTMLTLTILPCYPSSGFFKQGDTDNWLKHSQLTWRMITCIINELEGDEQKWSLCVTHGNSRYCSWNLSSRLQVWNVYYFHNIKNTSCLVESIIQKTGLVNLLFYTYSLHKSQLTFRTWQITLHLLIISK